MLTYLFEKDMKIWTLCYSYECEEIFRLKIILNKINILTYEMKKSKVKKEPQMFWNLGNILKVKNAYY